MSSIVASLPHFLQIHGFHPRKGMGQNFLVDTNVAERIVATAKAAEGSHTVEIGPGLGSLTIPLLRARQTLRVIEKDDRLLPLLRQRTAGIGHLIIEHGDALQRDFGQMAADLGGQLSIVANLPYNVSSPMLLHLLKYREVITDMTLMFQQEVAERITASPGGKDYGTLSVHCALWMTAKMAFHIHPQAFFPKPKVHSTVVRLERRAEPAAELNNPDVFPQIIRAAFGQRRKTLRNALKSLHPATDEWLNRANIDPTRRGETLSVVEFVHLANLYTNRLPTI